MRAGVTRADRPRSLTAHMVRAVARCGLWQSKRLTRAPHVRLQRAPSACASYLR